MIRIGSRGSALARWQAEHIAGRLRELGNQVVIEILTTTGDRMRHSPFQQVGTKGMFTKEIEEALKEDRIDVAVHSLKDLPTELQTEFILAAIPKRADARDAFVSVRYKNTSDMPAGAIVGTSSLRRQALLRSLRPDLQVRELRGNVDTRLKKLQSGEYDAIVVAAAGLDRLEQAQWVRERFTPQQMCPAPGQGALAVECRNCDQATIAAVAALDDSITRFAVTAERVALGALEGGCHVPIGVHCEPFESNWKLTAVVVRPDGSSVLREEMHFDGADVNPERARDSGREIANRLLHRGAGEILANVGSTENLRA